MARGKPVLQLTVEELQHRLHGYRTEKTSLERSLRKYQEMVREVRRRKRFLDLKDRLLPALEEEAVRRSGLEKPASPQRGVVLTQPFAAT